MQLQCKALLRQLLLQVVLLHYILTDSLCTADRRIAFRYHNSNLTVPSSIHVCQEMHFMQRVLCLAIVTVTLTSAPMQHWPCRKRSTLKKGI
jgi:hypothetical protein